MAKDHNCSNSVRFPQDRKKESPDLLTSSNESSHPFLESLQDMVIITDLKRSILEINSSAAIMLGYKRSELVGHDLITLLAKEEKTEVLKYTPPQKKQEGNFVTIFSD